MQNRIRDEIKEILANNGELTYESVIGMQYLGMVISGDFLLFLLVNAINNIKQLVRNSSDVSFIALR